VLLSVLVLVLSFNEKRGLKMLSKKAVVFFLLGLTLGSLMSYLIIINFYTKPQIEEKTFLKTQNQIIIGVYFSPEDKCSSKLIYWIDKANKSIHILIYSFTLDSISEALIKAHKRGIEVLIVMEKSQLSKYSKYEELKNSGIEVRLDNNPALMHNKIAIVDGKIVITGSYNWTESAEYKNNENMIIILSVDIAQIYEKEFQKIWNESK
jgi:phosphatidylserine/phosphatidylglycerophosphate/cardiolipin synthase-like enzyme